MRTIKYIPINANYDYDSTPVISVTVIAEKPGLFRIRHDNGQEETIHTWQLEKNKYKRTIPA